MANDPATLATYRLLSKAVEICYAHGVRHVVLSPGSRSAAVALSFLRFPAIAHFIIPDERSAAYCALGIAKQTQNPVALVCTSGTASLNYAPAIAEAFFSEIPLIVLSADRPPEWIGQADNQSIYQPSLYGNHVKGSFNLPVEPGHPDSYWYAQRQLNEALIMAKSGTPGPVHINIPLREPLYLDSVPEFPEPAKVIQIAHQYPEPGPEIISSLWQYKRIIVLAGMQLPDPELQHVLQRLVEKGMVLLPDIVSNLQFPGAISFADSIIDTINKSEKESLMPDLVISIGGPVISKAVKNFIRQSGVKAHWHITTGTVAADTYQHLSNIIQTKPAMFFSALERSGLSFDAKFSSHWQKAQTETIDKLKSVLQPLPFCELKAVMAIQHHLPEKTVLHLGNSLPVRHFSSLAFLDTSTEVFANRGTSGIDGSVSAATGHSIVDDRIHLLVIGDLSFMYDRNGLWNNYLRPNLKIIVFNNHGGGIFRAIPGPSQQPELEEYFVVKQPLSFEHTALQHGFRYLHCQDGDDLAGKLNELFSIKDAPAVLEIEFILPVFMHEVKRRIAGIL